MADYRLTTVEIERFHEQGFLGPFVRFPPAEAKQRLRDIESRVFTRPGPLPGHDTFMRHLDARLVYELCVHPTVVDRVASLYGPDLMLWNTSFWDKPPGGPAIPWHQDMFFWPNDPPLNITAWLGLSTCTRANACLRIIPGSHTRIVPHIKPDEKMLFALGADPDQVDEREAIEMELQPGQFVLFNERLLHGSPENHSTERRIGYVARFTLPQVKLFRDRVPLFPAHRALMVSGRDRFRLNQFADPPTAAAPAG